MPFNPPINIILNGLIDYLTDLTLLNIFLIKHKLQQALCILCIMCIFKDTLATGAGHEMLRTFS